MSTLKDVTDILFSRDSGTWRVGIFQDTNELHYEKAPDTPEGLLMLARLLPTILARFRDDTQPTEEYYKPRNCLD